MCDLTIVFAKFAIKLAKSSGGRKGLASNNIHSPEILIDITLFCKVTWSSLRWKQCLASTQLPKEEHNTGNTLPTNNVALDSTVFSPIMYVGNNRGRPGSQVNQRK